MPRGFEEAIRIPTCLLLFTLSVAVKLGIILEYDTYCDYISKPRR